MSKLVQSPLNPNWLIPEGWENVLGAQLDYRLGASVLHLWRVQLNQHLPSTGPEQIHRHSKHQLLYYQRGRGHLLAGEEKYTVEKGSVFLVPALCPHQFTNQNEEVEPAVCFALDFTLDRPDYTQIDLGGLPMQSEAAVLLSLVHAKSARPFQLQPSDQQRVDACIAEIVTENQARELGYAVLIQAHLLRLIALCLRATQRAHGFSQHFRHTAWRHHLVSERAAALIQEHATRQPELTLSEAARKCATSPNHLNKILKGETGLTFHQALLRRRLEIARELLEAGQLNCTEVALEAGFNESNYFSRAFRKHYGFSPSALVRQSRASQVS